MKLKIRNLVSPLYNKVWHTPKGRLVAKIRKACDDLPRNQRLMVGIVVEIADYAVNLKHLRYITSDYAVVVAFLHIVGVIVVGTLIYKMLGNGWTVDVIRHILQFL